MDAVRTSIREILVDRVFIAVLVLAVASAVLLYGIKGEDAVRAALDDDLRLFAMLVFFVPAVLFLSAYFEVLTPRRVIERWLGACTGLKGILIATLARTSQTPHGLRGAVPPAGQENRAARCADIGQAA